MMIMADRQNNPWLGLNTYTERDRLFGRDKESSEVTDIILNNLQTVIYGRSGIGKSSLLQAGVFPRLRYEDFIPVYIRLEHNAKEGYFSQIRRKVCEAAEDAGAQVARTTVGEPASLRELLYGYVFKDRQSGISKYSVLVFDQFEEIFTLTDKNHRHDVQDFFSQLASVLNDTAASADDGDFRIVICLREDYLYFLEQNSATIPSLKRNRYCLKALSHEQGREVICGPCPELVDGATAEAVLEKIDADHSGFIDPSILSLFMHELYEHGHGIITRENIQLFGDNIIAEFYEDGMKSVSYSSAAFLEERLVTSDGYRHYLSYSDALSAGVTEQELDLLKAKRIITIEKGERNRRIIELSHDVLCPVVLKNRNERKLREEKQQLAAKAKAMKKRNRVIAVLLLLAVTVIGVFIYMYVEMSRQRDNMLKSQSLYITSEAEKLAEDGHWPEAMALLLEVCPHDVRHPDRPLVNDLYNLLFNLCSSPYMKKALIGHKNDVRSAVFSPDGKMVVTASWDDTAIIWDALTGEKLKVLIGHINNVRSAVFSPDGKRVVTASSDNTAIVWDALTGEKLQVLEGHINNVRSAVFSPDGKMVVTASEDNTAIVWDALTGEKLKVLEGHTGFVTSAVFSPDGKMVVTASWDDTAIIWDALTGEKLRVDVLENALNVSIVFSPDGKSYFINSTVYSPDRKKKAVIVPDDNTVIICNVPEPQEVIDKARSILSGYELPTEIKKRYYLE